MSNSSKLKSKPKNFYLKNKVKIKSNVDFTRKQLGILDVCADDSTKIVFLNGPSGSSKTYLAVLAALELLNAKKISKILYFRNPIESSLGKLGSLPGEKEDKLHPYACPLFDKLKELLSETDFAKLITHEQRVIMEHVGFARGHDWKFTASIVDESQNLEEKELLMLMTRVGEGSKIFILGDTMQSDIGNKSGFKTYLDIFNESMDRSNGIYRFDFNEEDIVRSDIVKYVIKKIKEVNSQNSDSKS